MRIKFLPILLIFSALTLNLLAQENDQQKLSAPPVEYIAPTMPAGFELIHPAASPPPCFIEPDSTHIPVIFDDAPDTPGSGCDDCHSDIPFTIPFVYDICGTQWDQFWVNSNGNITFDTFFDIYTPEGIPNNSTAIMIAPFWGDVDLRTCGNVTVKIEPTYAIITWYEVGYFNQMCDKLNTFQVIISNGLDPIIGVGNNTAFYYKDMGWTTGSASSGIDGFGGSPAQVGLNANDGVLFDLIGAFDMPGFDAPVLDEYDMTITTGGIDWLDFQCFAFAAGSCDIVACNITDPIAIADACIEGTYNLFVSFDILDGGDTYTISVDGGAPMTFTYDTQEAGQSAFITGVTDPGTSTGTITISDNTDSLCVSVFDYIIPECVTCFSSIDLIVPITACSGSTFDVEALPDAGNITAVWTDSDGNIITPFMSEFINETCNPIDQDFTVQVECTSDSSVSYTETFTVTVPPADVSSFVSITAECDVNVIIDPSCETLFIESVPSIAPGTSGSDVVVLNDSTNICFGSFDMPFDYICAQCAITTANLFIEDCNGQEFTVAINVDGADLGSSYSVQDQNGTNLGTYSYNTDVVLGPFDGDGSSSYTFTMTDSDDAGCSFEETITAPQCIDCSINSISVVNGECANGEYSAMIDVDAFDNGTSFTIYDATGAAYGTYNYSDLPVAIGPFLGDGSTNLDFTLVDDLSSGCTEEFTVGAQNCYPCDIDNVVLSSACTSETSLDVSLSFSGSNVYTITDGTTVWNGISAGSDIYLGSYGENSDIVITITDELAIGCSYTSVALNVDCDCNSVPGTIMVNSMNVCPDDLSIVDADDFLLEPGQSVYYLYHNQPVVDNANLPDLVSDVYTTGSFLTNNGSVIPCGQTAYVTAIGAYEDTSMPGFPDYSDYCLTVSNTIPVNFLCPIVITLDESCDKSTGEFTYSFMVSGGLPQFISTEGYDILGDYYNGPAGLSGAVVVGPIPDLASYTVTATDGNGCSSSVSSTVECEKVPVELISFSGTARESGNVLNWETATEIENDYFTILSSINGISFEEIAHIDGAGNSSASSVYEYLDLNASNGVTYYRLAQTDWDGTYTEVSTISVKRTIGTAVILIESISPIPASDYLNISISSESNSDGIIQLIDVAGKIISTSNISLTQGRNEIGINVESISSGIYMAELITDDISISERILIE